MDEGDAQWDIRPSHYVQISEWGMRSINRLIKRHESQELATT
jgi:hypothetical protein